MLLAAILAAEAIAQEHVEPRERDTLRHWTYSRSATTDGSRIFVDGLRTTVSYSRDDGDVSLTTAVIASCHDRSDSGK